MSVQNAAAKPESCTCNGRGKAKIANDTGTQTHQLEIRFGRTSPRKNLFGRSRHARAKEMSRPAQKKNAASAGADIRSVNPNASDIILQKSVVMSRPGSSDSATADPSLARANGRGRVLRPLRARVPSRELERRAGDDGNQ